MKKPDTKPAKKKAKKPNKIEKFSLFGIDGSRVAVGVERSPRVATCVVCRESIPAHQKRVRLYSPRAQPLTVTMKGTGAKVKLNGGGFLIHRKCWVDLVNPRREFTGVTCWLCGKRLEHPKRGSFPRRARVLIGKHSFPVCDDHPEFARCASCQNLYPKQVLSPILDARARLVCESCEQFRDIRTVRTERKAETADREFWKVYNRVYEKLEKMEL